MCLINIKNTFLGIGKAHSLSKTNLMDEIKLRVFLKAFAEESDSSNQTLKVF